MGGCGDGGLGGAGGPREVGRENTAEGKHQPNTAKKKARGEDTAAEPPARHERPGPGGPGAEPFVLRVLSLAASAQERVNFETPPPPFSHATHSSESDKAVPAVETSVLRVLRPGGRWARCEGGGRGREGGGIERERESRKEIDSQRGREEGGRKGERDEGRGMEGGRVCCVVMPDLSIMIMIMIVLVILTMTTITLNRGPRSGQPRLLAL